MKGISTIIKKNVREPEDTYPHDIPHGTTDVSRSVTGYYKDTTSGKIYRIKATLFIEEITPGGNVYIPGVDLSPYSL